MHEAQINFEAKDVDLNEKETTAGEVVDTSTENIHS